MELSIAAFLADAADRSGESVAVVFDQADLTYGQLWDQARRFAGALRDRGIGPGDRIALLMGNSPEFPAVYFGVLALGAAVVPVNTLLRAAEITYVLRDSGALALVSDAASLDSARAAAESADLPVLLATMTAAPLPAYVPTEGSDIAVILYTSGTTGRAKGVVLTHASVAMNVAVTALSPFEFGSGDVLLGALPLFHTFGQICGMCVCFRAGAKLVLMSRFDPAQALELLWAQSCTVFMGVPTMYYDLLRAAGSSAESSRDRIYSLERAYSGGAALPPQILNRFREVFGCEIYEGYGLTETSPVVAYNDRSAPIKPGTVGRPIWGIQVEIARSELASRIELLPQGAVGEIVIRGHNVMAGYLNRPEATAEVLVDGWLRSGDLGRKDADGYLSIIDRKKDLIVRGGYNVYPRELEDVLAGHPDIAQVAVIGVPDERLGQDVCAVVIIRDGIAVEDATAAGIISWARDRLAAYKYPRRIVFVAEFPVGPSGKVLKRELAARIA
ncbi:long-chain fatty acid--CoA ligase [Nocardia sp. NPDC048505]|uniref:long-chain-fatty-acid--CoA ligase n=1 Tax=Nocardia sp. NPDC048505 TaxID=3155756 RepID=UPI0033FE86D4